jgi:hypothetical protein
MKRTWLLVLVIGCSNHNSPSGPKIPLPPGCDKMLSQCLAIQQICGAGPTCEACPEGQYADASGVCKPIGTPMTHDFPEITSNSGDELFGCRSWTLNNSTELWVNAVELTQDELSHHSNWFFVPDDKYNVPDGIWNCRDQGFDELGAAVAGGVLYAQSTQARHEVQKFPNGAAIRIPPWSTIVSNIHVLNATQMANTGHTRLSIYATPLDQVKVKLAPFHLGFTALQIPPMESSRSQGSCDLYSAFQSAFNHDVDAKVYYLLPHYHTLGYHFFVNHVGGKNDGKSLFDSMGAIGEARGRAYDPPIDLSGDDGLAFGCDFDNPRPDTVQWGFGDQEMCELLGFSDSPLAWTGEINMVHPDTTATDMPTYTGSCGVLAFDYDFTKAGGPGPK